MQNNEQDKKYAIKWWVFPALVIGGLANITKNTFQWAGEKVVDTYENIARKATESGYPIDDQTSRDLK